MDIRIFDVEHGDSILILSAKNEAVLVDCGYKLHHRLEAE